MRKVQIYLCLLITLFLKNVISSENTYPLIGILSVPENGQEFPVNNTGIVNANYVRWLESNGMEAVAIHPWYAPDELDSILVKLNGIIIQGETTSLAKTTTYYKTVLQITERIKTFYKTDPSFNFPIFGVCGGFELLVNVVAGEDILIPQPVLKTQNRLIFDENEIVDTKLFNQIPKSLIEVLKNTDSLWENHNDSVSPNKFTSATSKIKEYMNIVALSKDKDGKNFVAAAEGIKDYPFFGVQFHPEIIAFNKMENFNVPDTYEAIMVSRHFGRFLLKQAEGNSNVFENYRGDKNYLTGKLPDFADINSSYYYRFNQFVE